MKEIKSLDEIHHVLLGIAKVFGDICSCHGIPYTMIGGTMLGAIRHKGFIPWDDDMDFGVDCSNYLQLIEILKEELKYPFRCVTFEDCDAVKYPFLKIEDMTTCIDDKTVDLPVENKIGLNIDVFPLFSCSKCNPKITLIYKLLKINTLLFIESTRSTFVKRFIRKILRSSIKVKKVTLLRFVSKIAFSLKGPLKGNVFGRWHRKEFFDKYIYDDLQKYDFESIQLYGINNYDVYLKQLYSDYMQLPPEEERLVHLSHVYYR